MKPSERLAELYAKVEAFHERVRARHKTGGITCSPGCDGCCQEGLTVTALEASVIRAFLAARGRLPTAPRPGGCALLDAEGRCTIYPVRPLICRAHGLPLRFSSATGGRALPVIDACPKNFVGHDLRSLDPGDVLDQATLSTIVGALDAAHADMTASPRGERVALAALLDEHERLQGSP
jgi:hypothetical protein